MRGETFFAYFDFSSKILVNIYMQRHNLYKLKYVSLEEVKSVPFQQRYQSEATESNLLVMSEII